jgi:hypothetical protein
LTMFFSQKHPFARCHSQDESLTRSVQRTVIRLLWQAHASR